MKANLTDSDIIKLSQAIKKETFRQSMERNQVNNQPSIWQLLPFILLVILVIGTIVILVLQGVS